MPLAKSLLHCNEAASCGLLACLRVETACHSEARELAVMRLTPVYNATSCGHIQAELTDLNDRALGRCFRDLCSDGRCRHQSGLRGVRVASSASKGLSIASKALSEPQPLRGRDPLFPVGALIELRIHVARPGRVCVGAVPGVAS